MELRNGDKFPVDARTCAFSRLEKFSLGSSRVLYIHLHDRAYTAEIRGNGAGPDGPKVRTTAAAKCHGTHAHTGTARLANLRHRQRRKIDLTTPSRRSLARLDPEIEMWVRRLRPYRSDMDEPLFFSVGRKGRVAP